MTTLKTITLTREQLYDQVWKTPMRTLANRYGLSDVGLAKTCKSHDIPRPPVGYWAKKEVGKALPQPPLPPNHDPKRQQIKLWDGPRPTPVAEPPQEFDADIQELLERAMTLPPVLVAASLHNLHPLIRKTRDALENQTYEDHGLVSPSGMRTDPVVEVRVAKSTIRRALLFMDALFKAIEKVGGAITIEKLNHWQPAVTVIRFAEIVVASVRLRERYKQVKRPENTKDRWTYPTHDFKPTGRLVLDHAPHSYKHPYCEDSEKTDRRIESHVNKLILQWVNEAGRTRIRRREEAEEQRIRAEEERLRQERDAELKRRRDDLQRQQKAEQAKIDHLLAESENWRKSQLVRSYLAEIEQVLSKRTQPVESDSDLAKWIHWAYQQADRLDPLIKSPPSILDVKLESL